MAIGKSKPKERKGYSNHQDDPKNRKRGIVKRDYSQTKPQTKPASQHRQSSQKKATIPFDKQDRVLLVGEGDFSFALSLQQQHGLKRIVATCFDSESELHAKYSHVKETLESITAIQTTRDGHFSVNAYALDDGLEDEGEWNGFSSPDDSSSDESFEDGDFIFRDDLLQAQPSSGSCTQATIHYGINATKLSTAHRKLLLSDGPFSKIVFNFPHVGGLSTDVNRQVRSNQELLVGFFEAAKGLLASESNPVSKQDNHDEEDDDIDFDLETGEPLNDSATPTKGQIIVTLFEGEPYTLWNIRDLARHCGLKVVESFKFPWSAYPSYKHARTIGEISGKGSDGKRPGAWRGEERDARMYVLEVKDEEQASQSLVQPDSTGGNQTVLGKRKQKGEINGEESDASD